MTDISDYSRSHYWASLLRHGSQDNLPCHTVKPSASLSDKQQIIRAMSCMRLRIGDDQI